ncbi:MAG: hypothetical protein KDE31_37970 [Caldilineaceae bacterium]|nr:hypothetical protein [Caldilineaceae bacterium]
MTTIRSISPEQMAVYRATAARRQQVAATAVAERKQRAYTVARQAASMLKDRFGATAVWLFGSLAHEQWFTTTSDIDLAAWGIAPADYFRAVAYLQDISPEFAIDLVTMEDCKPTLRDRILLEGKPL